MFPWLSAQRPGKGHAVSCSTTLSFTLYNGNLPFGVTGGPLMPVSSCLCSQVQPHLTLTWLPQTGTLVLRLSAQASKPAPSFLNICSRALDLPSVIRLQLRLHASHQGRWLWFCCLVWSASVSFISWYTKLVANTCVFSATVSSSSVIQRLHWASVWVEAYSFHPVTYSAAEFCLAHAWLVSIVTAEKWSSPMSWRKWWCRALLSTWTWLTHCSPWSISSIRKNMLRNMIYCVKLWERPLRSSMPWRDSCRWVRKEPRAYCGSLKEVSLLSPKAALTECLHFVLYLCPYCVFNPPERGWAGAEVAKRGWGCRAGEAGEQHAFLLWLPF